MIKISAISRNPTKNSVLLTHTYGALTEFNLPARKITKEHLKNDKDRIFQVFITNNNRHFWTFGSEGSVKQFNLNPSKLIKNHGPIAKAKGAWPNLQFIQITPNQKTFIIGSDGHITTLSLSTHHFQPSLFQGFGVNRPEHCVITPDSKEFIIGTESGRI